MSTSNRIEAWIDKDLLVRTKANLEFLGLILRLPIEWDDNLPKDWEDRKAADVIQQIEDDAEKLTWVIDPRYDRPTEDEEITALKEFIEEHGERPYRSGLARQAAGIVERYQCNQDNAYGVVAALVEKFRTDLRAIQMMVRAFRQGGTHHIKNSRAYVAEDMIDQMVAELMGVDVDNPRAYDIGWGNESFDFRRLQAENKAKDAQIGHLNEEIVALSAKLKEAELNTGPVEEEEIPF